MTNGFVALIRLLLFPVERRIQPLDPTPLLQPHYQPSSLLQVGPSQCSASVRSPRGFYHLCFSLHIGTTGSRSSAREPGSASRLLYAGRRLPSNQVSDRLIPQEIHARGFDDISFLNDASSVGSLSFAFRTLTCSRSRLKLFASTLTTTTFDRSSLKWFGIRS